MSCRDLRTSYVSDYTLISKLTQSVHVAKHIDILTFSSSCSCDYPDSSLQTLTLSQMVANMSSLFILFGIKGIAKWNYLTASTTISGLTAEVEVGNGESKCSHIFIVMYTGFSDGRDVTHFAKLCKEKGDKATIHCSHTGCRWAILLNVLVHYCQ